MVYRHTIPVRIAHWVAVLCFAILFMSGLQIFNAHPALYWGAKSDFSSPILSMTARRGEDGRAMGFTTVFGHSFETTGVLGLSAGWRGPTPRGFPSWITLPSYQDLATGRRWHFFFAWILAITGACYLIYAVASGHLRRHLIPTGRQLRHIGGTIRDHILFRFPKGTEARHYNVLQKLSYLGVIFILVPVLIAAGLAMSPAIDAALPWLPAVFGGRQSARTIHFICAFLLVAFALVHIAMVLVSGVWNNLRSMITGRYAIRDDSLVKGKEAEHDRA